MKIYSDALILIPEVDRILIYIMSFVRPTFRVLSAILAVSKKNNEIPRIYQTTTGGTMFYRQLKLSCIHKIRKEDETTIQPKYQEFKDESEVVLDIYDEARIEQYGYNLPQIEEEENDRYQGLNLNRGLTGVFDIEDLIDVLKRENALDIFVAKIPDGINYADYICVASVKSTRHMHAVCQFVRRVYKMKRSKKDRIPKLEGEKSKDWQALDLGNIALHIFSKEARGQYDLDSLWAVGPKMDLEYNKVDPLVQMLENNTYSLDDLKPAS